MSPGASDASSSENSVSLVPIASEDLDAVPAMAARIWPGAYGAILSPEQIEYMLRWMYDVETLRTDLAAGISMWWILRNEERIGFLAAGPREAAGLCPLHKFYLMPEVQGRGLGSAALAALVARLRSDRVSILELRVNRHNQAAIAFYQRNGFTVHTEDCRDIGGGFVMDDYVMRLDLARGTF